MHWHVWLDIIAYNEFSACINENARIKRTVSDLVSSRVLQLSLLLTFLALLKPCSRASWWASSSVPSCNWTRKWSVKTTSSSAAAICINAWNNMRATAVPSLKNPSIVCFLFLRAVWEWMLSNRDWSECSSTSPGLFRTHLLSHRWIWGVGSRTVRRSGWWFVYRTESAFSASL